MPITKISEYSATAASNTDINGIDIAEGCAPSGINDAIRTLMKQIKDLQAGTSGDTIPLTAGGTGSTTASAARTALGLGIGTNVQAYDQNLTTFVNVFTLPTADGTANQVLKTDGSGVLGFATAGGSLTGVTDSASPFETSLGHQAGNVTTGTNNTFIGYQAGLLNTTGQRNTAVGFGALDANTTAPDNTAVGHNALGSNTTGNSNIAIGNSAMINNTTGNSNVAVGLEALNSNTTGEYNTACGQEALKGNTTGLYNTAHGAYAMFDATTGSGNTVIGTLTSTGSIAPAFQVTTQSNRLSLGSTSVTNAYVQVAFTVVSDARDKTDFSVVPHGLDFVKKLQPTAYRYKMNRTDTEGHGPIRYGFKAQEVLTLEGNSPVIVDAEDSEKLRFNDQCMIAVLVKALQELSNEVNVLKTEINNLKGV